jgi:hypothetical protein
VSHPNTQKHLSSEDVRLPSNHPWQKLPIAGAIIGLVFLGAAIGGGLSSGDGGKRFLYAYLVAFMFFLSIGLGGMFFTMIQHITRAGWSVAVRRLAENLMATLPLFALLFVPILLKADVIFYQWAGNHEELQKTDHHWKLVEHKLGYLNMGFFTSRAVFMLVIWALLAWWFRSKSVQQDSSGDHDITRSMQKWSPLGIALFASTLTFAAFDWMMSLDPHWFSTIFGVYYFAGSAVSSLAVLSLLIIGLRSSGVLKNIITSEHDQDVGKLLFGFNVFWTYIAFSQYILIWYANIPEETMWFDLRNTGSWAHVSLVLAFGHFVVPFFFLMSRHIKRRPMTLAIGAIWLLAMHYLDMYWLIMPTIQPGSVQFHWLDIVTFIGIGGFFVSFLGFWMKRDAIVPFKDPRLPESLSFQNY